MGSLIVLATFCIVCVYEPPPLAEESLTFCNEVQEDWYKRRHGELPPAGTIINTPFGDCIVVST